ncbi:MAG: pyruvate ferredoxin oxidoreductase [Candidatus Micrarchaeia archaeon]
MRKITECSLAIAETVRNCDPDVIACYPITPSTHIAERLAEFYANGEIREYITVESEHSALSALIGASAAGGRTFTATSSQGLLLMHEVLFNASGMRLPIVMFNALRAVSAPLNIWCDHQDAMSQRDTGWIQIYAKSSQDAVDSIVQAYKIAEKVMLPVMVCGDGFFLTHAVEEIDIPDTEIVKKYLPPLKIDFKLDTSKPISLGVYAVPEDYQYFRQDLVEDMERSIDEVLAADEEWKKITGRGYGLMEEYQIKDADRVIVAMGTQASNGKEAVNKLIEKGERVGLLILRIFRPFPYRQVSEALHEKEVLVFDRSLSPGGNCPLFSEISNAIIMNGGSVRKLYSVVGGLGGRDNNVDVYVRLFEMMKTGRVSKWIY